MNYDMTCMGVAGIFTELSATQWSVASPGLVSPGAVTDGVTLFFPQKN